MLADPFASNILDPVVHDRLIADIDMYAYDARILPEHICTPLSVACTSAEIAYVKRYRFHKGDGVAGFAYVGKNSDADVAGRMYAMAGAFVRNFIRARVMVMSELFDHVDNEGIPDMSVLLLPDFHVPAASGGSRSSWKVSNILGVLMTRKSLGLQTIVYTPDLESVGQDYGPGVRFLIMQHYNRIKI